MSSCLISADGDVAGLGVRIAFYMQALLPLVSIAFVPYSSVETANIALLTQYCKRGNGSLVVFSSTGAALLVTAFIERSLRDLSPYHALIVLNLTWMTLISSCCRAAVVYYLEKSIPGSFVYKINRTNDTQNEDGSESKPGESRRGETKDKDAELSPFLSHITVLGLHVLITGVLGWLLFDDIEGFAGPAGCPHDTVLWMFTSFVHITDAGPRLFWKVVYMTALLAPVSLPVLGCLVTFIFLVTFDPISRQATKLSNLPYLRGLLPPPPSALALKAFETLCVTLLALLIASTEKTIAHNPVERGEDDWGFGQILALILAAFALYESWEGFQMTRQLRSTAGGERSILPTSSRST